MMKKIPILILTLIFSAILSGLFSEKTHALYTDEKGHTWWTVAELLEYKKEVDKDEQKYCSKYDFECTEQYRKERLEYDENYTMLSRFQDSLTLVTGFNLKKGTIKVYISNEHRLPNSMTYGTTVYKFAAAWFDNQEASDNFYIAFRNPERLLNNEIPGTHAMLVLYGDEARKLAKEQELEFEMLPGSNIGHSRKGSFKYSIETSIFNGSTFTSDYSVCTEDRNYPNGECLLMYSPSERFSKWKFFAAPAEPEPEEPIDEESINEEPTSNDESIPEDEHIEDEPESGDNVTSEPTEEIPTTIPALIKAPNTGEYANISEACQKTIEFPWWIVGFVVLGDLAALWLFFPRKNRT